MLHVLLIVIVAAVLARDGVADLPTVGAMSAGAVAAWTIGAMVVLAAAQHVALWALLRAIDRRGSWTAVSAADWTLVVARLGATALHVLAVFGIGWVDAVRSLLGGDWVAIDELVAVTPAMFVVVMGWVSYYPIDRSLREASLIGALDAGAPMPSLPTRGQYVLDQTRHQVLLVLAPVAVIAAWSEGADAALARLPEPWNDAGTALGGAVSAGAHLLGVVLVIAMLPLAIRWLWDTVPLGAGALRDRLLEMCAAQGVRCRDLLVWRTHSRMLNGAVIGVVPRLRYILLTDTLLEALEPSQVEAVMAHEVAHARRHHLPWLMAAIMSTLTLTWSGVATALDVAARAAGVEGGWAWGAVGGASVVVTGVVVVLVFGWVSRRFEQQADAFAAQHLSGRTRATEGRRDMVITAEAVIAMGSALGQVARRNHVPREKFSFRHGSIASRQRRLERLVGTPAHRLPIDGVVRWIKVATGVGVVATIGLSVAAALLG